MTFRVIKPLSYDEAIEAYGNHAKRWINWKNRINNSQYSMTPDEIDRDLVNELLG